MTDTYNPGQPVGWRRERYIVFKVYEGRDYLTLLRPGDPVHKRFYARMSELTDAPPMPDHVQQAAQDAVRAGVFSNARRAVFGEDA